MNISERGLIQLSMMIAADATITDWRWRAYLLATAKHETAGTFSPIYERGDTSYFQRYEAPGPLALQLGNIRPGDGFTFRGRGYVQITGRANYFKLSKIVGVDLVSSPDLALSVPIAYRILSAGMVQGLFTGAGLARFISGTACDFVGARRIVNGQDRAAEIAAYADDYSFALRPQLAS